MYTSFFGFREAPFSVTPDPRFFYTNPLYQEAFAALLYGINAKKGFIVMTGEVGTGKTTLLRKLMRNLEATVQSVFIFNTQLSFPELLQLILHDLGLAHKRMSTLKMILELNQYLIEQLRKGHTVSLLIDEAQNLSDDTLEGIRLLSNLETDKEKLLQIVLTGQPELEMKLDQPQLRQLKQRVALQCCLARLKDQEVGPFIDFRLRGVGYEGHDLFHPDAVHQIAFYSKGIPRLINIICDNALLIAYAGSQKKVSADTIREVAQDLWLGSELQATEGNGSRAETESKRTGKEPVQVTEEKPMQPADDHAILTALQRREGTNKLISTEKTTFRIAHLAKGWNGKVTIPPKIWAVLSSLDGSQDVQTVAEIVGLSCEDTAKVLYELQTLGLVTVVRPSAKANPDALSARLINSGNVNLPPQFIDRMTLALTEAMGPMAPLVLRRQIDRLGGSHEAFPKTKVGELIESVSAAILNETMKADFHEVMFQEIVALNNPTEGRKIK